VDYQNEFKQRKPSPQEMMDLAEKARKLAYAPYSKYQVGAALLTKSGKIYLGCNVENASYGLTVCGERVAVFKAISEGETEFEALAIATPSRRGNGPCGSCRQVLREFCNDLTIYVRKEGDKILSFQLTDLLPKSFGPQNLDGSE